MARERSDAPLELVNQTAANGQGEDPLGVAALISTLPGRQREVLFLRYYADLEYQTIADVLEIEVGTVSATLAAAHKALRMRFEEARP